MANGIYVAMNGASARTTQLEAVADNLANVDTPGFRANRTAFEAFLPAGGRGEEGHVAAVKTSADPRPGRIVETGRPLDLVPADGAFLSVSTEAGAAYTRAGHLEVDAEGRLLAGGRQVLDTRGRPIDVPIDTPVTVGEDGVVRTGDQPLARLGLYRIEGDLERTAPTLLRPASDAQVVASDAEVRTGHLEVSASSALEATVQLVGAQRSFDTAMQALETYRRLDQRATDIGRVR